MTISPDELLLVLGGKEAELFVTRKQLAEAAAEADRLRAALTSADAELATLRAGTAPTPPPEAST